MKDLKGTKTEKNLLEAFAGESMARNKYTYFASAAKKEGYEQIAAIFLETAENEREHAKLHFQALNGIGNTIENLKAAADGENHETTKMYPTMAKDARAEGFDDIARTFELVGSVEATHRDRYLTLLKNVETQAVFKKSHKVLWHCRNCGHVIENDKAPEMCPTCKHPKAYFEVMPSNY